MTEIGKPLHEEPRVAPPPIREPREEPAPKPTRKPEEVPA